MVTKPTKLDHPNLLWILTDHLRHQALSCNGEMNIQTANIDRLASEGSVADIAVTHYPVCIPARAGLMTGQYSHVNGVRLHGDLLPPDRRTVAHAYRDAGYRTSYVGKWHLGGSHSVDHPGSHQEYWVHPQLRGGFEDWYGFDLMNDYYDVYYCTGDSVDPVKLEGYQTDGLTDLSLEYLSNTAAQSGRPWFHVLSFESPHGGRGNEENPGPYPVPSTYREDLRPESMVLRPNVPEDLMEQAREAYVHWYGMVRNIDYNVGRVLDWLEESDQAQNTLVVLSADHGDMGRSHSRIDKQVAYEESIRIPLIMGLPGVIPAGSRCDGIVSMIDIWPTCAALCGVPVFPEVQGMDLSAAVCGQEGTRRTEALIQWLGETRYHWGNHPYRAIRTLRYTYCVSSVETDERKYIQSLGGSTGHFRLLFDNQEDRFQMNNLFGRPEEKKLQQALHARLCSAIWASGETLPEFISSIPTELEW